MKGFDLRPWFFPLPLLLLTQHLWPCLPTDTIPIESCYYSLYSASSTSPNGVERAGERRNMKVDLIGIDSDSQCFTDTIKITNNVFSMNK